MYRLLKIDLKKLIHYRTFWIVLLLYSVVIYITTTSGIHFVNKGMGLNSDTGSGDLTQIPIYHFPDVWQNVTYISGFFKIILAYMVIISVVNEFEYRTVRQNIIDGLSRGHFILSKVLTNFLLAVLSMLMVFLIALFLGIIHTPDETPLDMVTGIEFIFIYFLEVFMILSIALFLGIWIRRSGLAMLILLIAPLIEFILREGILNNRILWFTSHLPMKVMGALINMPFSKYFSQPTQSEPNLFLIFVALAWVFVFNYLGYWKLKKSDL